jgi:uncharacterized protein with HEPN domain
MRTDRLRLLDAIEQIESILSFSERGWEPFFNDLVIQSAVLNRLALVGEACRGVSPELSAAHPEVPWLQIIAFRNVVTMSTSGSISSSHDTATVRRG